MSTTSPVTGTEAPTAALSTVTLPSALVTSALAAALEAAMVALAASKFFLFPISEWVS